MSHFLGTHQNRLDAKGRVSVPASFRAALRAGAELEAATSLILRTSHKHPCIEGWPVPTFQAMSRGISMLKQFSDEHEDLSTSVYANAYQTETDKEGRILLSADLVEHAGLSSQVSFMGMGETFQIWEPAACARRKVEAREAARRRDLGPPAESVP